MPLAAGSRLGPYEILAAIGAGGMGEVYKARDTRLDRTVAVKVLPSHLSQSEEIRQRFEREARTISQLSHPHICALYDVGREGGTEYLVMEFLEGESLAQRLLKGPLPPEQVLKYGIEIADALDKAHRQGIVHRDLKPGNVMLTKSGVKLVDFGLARVLLPAAAGEALTSLPTQAGTNLTEKGTVLGTFQYMSPEQLEAKEADSRTDIFALGAVLYEMATGKKAFSGSSQATLIAAIISSEPPPISSIQPMVSPALDRVVKTCLAKDPEDRWQTAHDVMLELKWVAEGGSQAGVPAPVVARRKNRERTAWALFAAAALAAAALAWGYVRRAPPPPRALRTSILVPEKLSIDIPVLSPDGTHLAYLAGERGGTSQLWVRPLASLSAQPLAGTEKAELPFWSPDGRSIAFFAEKKLKKIDIAGGPALTICDADGLGGSWNQEGTILFALPSSPLYRIPASGGTPVAVTKLDVSKHVTTHRYPHFLPDGRHFLYLAANLAGGPNDPANQIHVASLDGREDKAILQANSSAAYSPGPAGSSAGFLLFAREGNLLAQPFHPGRRETVGDVFPVAQGISMNGQFWNLAEFSTSRNGFLVYQTPHIVSNQMVWFMRDGRKLGEAGAVAVGGYVNPQISPDGKRIAVTVRDSTTRKRDIWIHDVARATLTRLTGDGSDSATPVWSPDGSRVLFSSDRKHQADIYIKPVAGGGAEEALLEAEGQKVPSDWSFDGRFIAFEGREPTGARRVALSILPLTGDRKSWAFLQRGTEIGTSRFSPDGRWLAYTSLESGRWEVYVAAFPGPGGRWQVSTAGGYHPRWRRDGKELFYLSEDRKMMSVEIKTQPAFEAGVPKALFEAQIANLGPSLYDVSADGERFLIVTPAGSQATPPLTLAVNWAADLKR